MSDATDVVAPEADPAVPETSLDAPEDVTAVDTESATLRKRFDGLMAAHQKALGALVEEREARTAAEARLQEGTTVSDDNATLSEVQALRQELAESRLATAKAEALQDYPDAADFADLITGASASEIREVTRAFAERAARIKGQPALATDTVDDTTTVVDEPILEHPVVVPVVTGGELSPGQPTTRADALAEAYLIATQVKPDSQEAWDAFFVSQITDEAANGLA